MAEERAVPRNMPLPTELNQASVEVTAADLPLHCPLPSQKLWNTHPRVFLAIEATGEARCPSCGGVERGGRGEEGVRRGPKGFQEAAEEIPDLGHAAECEGGGDEGDRLRVERVRVPVRERHGVRGKLRPPALPGEAEEGAREAAG